MRRKEGERGRGADVRGRGKKRADVRRKERERGDGINRKWIGKGTWCEDVVWGGERERGKGTSVSRMGEEKEKENRSEDGEERKKIRKKV